MHKKSQSWGCLSQNDHPSELGQDARRRCELTPAVIRTSSLLRLIYPSKKKPAIDEVESSSDTDCSFEAMKIESVDIPLPVVCPPLPYETGSENINSFPISVLSDDVEILPEDLEFKADLPLDTKCQIKTDLKPSERIVRRREPSTLIGDVKFCPDGGIVTYEPHFSSGGLQSRVAKPTKSKRKNLRSSLKQKTSPLTKWAICLIKGRDRKPKV